MPSSKVTCRPSYESRRSHSKRNAERQLPHWRPTLVGYTLAELKQQHFPTRRALLSIGHTVVLREAHIGQIYAIRGVGKTWFAQTLALVAATGIEALGFATNEPCKVLYIDGEMGSEEIQERFEYLAVLFNRHSDMATRGHLFNQLYNDNLVVVAADWQDEYLPRLDTPEGQAAIEPWVNEADLIIPDNRSCPSRPRKARRTLPHGNLRRTGCCRSVAVGRHRCWCITRIGKAEREATPNRKTR